MDPYSYYSFINSLRTFLTRSDVRFLHTRKKITKDNYGHIKSEINLFANLLKKEYISFYNEKTKEIYNNNYGKEEISNIVKKLSYYASTIYYMLKEDNNKYIKQSKLPPVIKNILNKKTVNIKIYKTTYEDREKMSTIVHPNYYDNFFLFN